MPDKKDEKKKERISIFIDGSNLYYSLQDFGISKIDFQKLVNILKKDRLLVFVFYYNAPLDISIDAKKYWDQQKFFDALRRIPGFNVVLARLRKHKREDGTFKFEVKRDDICLAVDLVSGAYENLYDTALIVSGDEDFVPAIRKVQKLGKKVENIYCTYICAVRILKSIKRKLVGIKQFAFKIEFKNNLWKKFSKIPETLLAFSEILFCIFPAGNIECSNKSCFFMRRKFDFVRIYINKNY